MTDLQLSSPPSLDDAADDRTDDRVAERQQARARLLRERGAHVVAWDPEATTDAVEMADDPMQAVDDADLLLVATEWPAFLRLDLAEAAKRMHGEIMFDARNLFDADSVRTAGLSYMCLGRPHI